MERDSELAVRRFTVEEFEQMAEAGVLRGDERLELLGGRIVVITAQNEPHVIAVELTKRALERVFRKGCWVRQQAPLRFVDIDTRPEPDVAVVKGSPARPPARLSPSSALLVVEVSDTSLRVDRGLKARLYAAAGVRDYWIVNLVDRVLEVHREPRRSGGHDHYRSVEAFGVRATVAPLAAPRTRVRVADLLPRTT